MLQSAFEDKPLCVPRQLAELLQLSVEEVCADFDAMLRHDWRRLGISAEEVREFCDAGSGVVSFLAPCVSQSLRSDARCCGDAGSGDVSLASLPVSPSLCGEGWSRAKPTEAASSLRVLGLTLLAASFCLMLTALNRVPGKAN